MAEVPRKKIQIKAGTVGGGVGTKGVWWEGRKDFGRT